MAVSNAQKIAKAKYQQSSRTLIAADVSKGKGEFYRQSATGLNLSLSMLIQKSIEEFIARHSGKEIDLDNRQAAETEKIPKADKQLLEEFNKLPKEAQKSIRKLIDTFNATNQSVAEVKS